MAPTTRMSAVDRREQVLRAALAEFARGGLAGTSTEAIAARAGISQPYLFRLFATKRDLFLAAISDCFDNVMDTFTRAAEGLSGAAAMAAMGKSYDGLIADRDNLLGQLQTYAACDDPDVRQAARDGFRRLYRLVHDASGAPPEQMALFFAVGMLCNVTAALQLDEVAEPWARALIDHGSLFGPSG